MVQKSPEAFRTISEVASTLDLPAHVLRFWESRFSQIKPIKRGGGRRYYRPQDINLLRGIRELLHSEGESIKGVQKILREHGVRHVVALGSGDNQTSEPSPPAPEQHQPAKPVATLVPDPEPRPEPSPEPRPEPTPQKRQAQSPDQEPKRAQRPPARPAATGANPQRDLFDDFLPDPTPDPAPAPAPTSRAIPENKQREIRDLRDRLVELRETMKAQD